MINPNRDYFQQIYPNSWMESQPKRSSNMLHYRYQQITLNSLDCFPGCSLLECGCGSGELLQRLAQRCPDIHLFGADLGRASMRWARKGTLADFYPHFVESDIGRLPIANESVDRILASSVLWYLPDPRLAIYEMIRVLKPGGRFVFDVRNPYHISSILAQWSLSARRMMGKLAPYYSFLSPRSVDTIMRTLPVHFQVTGFLVLLPDRVPILGEVWGNWVSYSERLSFQAGKGRGRWLAQKLLVTGIKL